MLLFTRPFALALFSGALFLGSACSKEKTAPQTGTVTGDFMRSDALTTVTITPAAGSATSATPTIDSFSGVATYNFPDLAPGSYTVTYNPQQYFVTPAAQTVTIKAGETTTIPLLLIPFKATEGSISFAVNGKPTSAVYVDGSFTGNLFTLIGKGYEGQILLLAQPTSVPDTYTLTGNFGTSPRSYTHNVTSGTLTITNRNQTSRRVSGTFSVTGTAKDGSGTGTVTNGVFTNLVY